MRYPIAIERSTETAAYGVAVPDLPLDFVWRRAAEWIWIAPRMIGGGQYDRGFAAGLDGKIKATVSLRAVEGRKCLSAHCFGWHCNGTAQNAPVPLQPKRCSESISRAPPIAA